MKDAELDVASRYGGEEFVIIMPETGSQGAGIARSACARRWRRSGAEDRPLSAAAIPTR